MRVFFGSALDAGPGSGRGQRERGLPRAARGGLAEPMDEVLLLLGTVSVQAHRPRRGDWATSRGVCDLR